MEEQKMMGGQKLVPIERKAVKVQIVNRSYNPLPEYETEHSVGLDVRAFLPIEIFIAPGRTSVIPTGLHVAIPEGYEIQVRPRSGMAAKQGVTVLNTPGTIDPDYRGEIKVILFNSSDSNVMISNGDRIAQLVLSEKPRLSWDMVEELPETARGEGGLGHTGKH